MARINSRLKNYNYEPSIGKVICLDKIKEKAIPTQITTSTKDSKPEALRAEKSIALPMNLEKLLSHILINIDNNRIITEVH